MTMAQAIENEMFVVYIHHDNRGVINFIVEDPDDVIPDDVGYGDNGSAYFPWNSGESVWMIPPLPVRMSQADEGRYSENTEALHYEFRL